MILLRTFASCLLLSFVAQQVSMSSGARTGGNNGAERTVSAAAGRAQRSRSKSAVSGRGKFTKENMQCTWTAQDAGESVKLSVLCEDPEARRRGGMSELQCNYYGKPRSCPAYASNPSGFWKQVSRAFKRLHAEVCYDDRKLVKAGMCKRAPREAHFKLDVFSSIASAQSGGDDDTPPPRPWPQAPTPEILTTQTNTSSSGEACTERVDHRKTAEEYCSSSWASVCSFFLSMLQSGDC